MKTNIQTALVLTKDLSEIARSYDRTAMIQLARKLAPVLGDIVVVSVDGRIYTVRGSR